MFMAWGTFYPSSPCFGQIASASFNPWGNPEKAPTEGFWQSYREFSRRGEKARANSELEKLYQWKLDRGIRNHYGYAAALIRESERLKSVGQKEDIPLVLTYAERMAPDFSQVYYSQAIWLLSEKFLSPGDVILAFGHAFRGLGLSFYNLEEGLPWVANLTFWVLLSAILLLSVFAFYLLGRYHSYFAHHLGHGLRVAIDPRIIRALALLILFLPFFLGLGWMWLLVPWFLIFGIYARPADRRAMMLVLVFALIIPMGIRWYSSCLTSMTSPGFTEVTRANWGVWNPELYETLKRLRSQNPSDPQLLQAAGLVAKRMGDFRGAEEFFRELTRLESNSAAAFTNLGNIFFSTQRLDEAIAAYKKAIDLDPSQAEAHYNLGQVYLQKLRLNEAESHFQEARGLAPKRISYFTHIASRNPNRIMIDPTLKPMELWRRVWNGAWGEEKMAATLWAHFWDGIPLGLAEGALILLLLTIAALPKLLGERDLIRSCESCGQTLCSRCGRSMMTGKHCYPCRKILSDKPLGEPQALAQKRKEIVEFKERQKALPIVLSRILPGIGHLWRGQWWEGVLILFLFILLLVKLALGSGWVPSPMVENVPFVLPGLVLTVLLLLLLYLGVQTRMRRLSGLGGKI